jgi:hypothetical protein
MKLKELLDNIFDSGVRHYSEDNIVIIIYHMLC